LVLGNGTDPNGNTTAPTGSLANSGWQYEGNWSFFLATPIAPHYFVTATHIGGSPTDGLLTYNGVTYDNDTWTDFGDLRLWHTNGTFYSYAPIYNPASTLSGGDGPEWTMSGGGKDVVMIGRGYNRGADVRLPDTPGGVLHGWQWGTYDFTRRWGQNTISGFETNAATNDWLAMNFDSTGPNEAAMASGDSGGAVFINVNGQWKLAGINSAVTGPYKYATGGDSFSAAMFDTSGFLYGDGSAITDPTTISYANRVGKYFTNLQSIINLPPTWNVNASGTWTTASNWAQGAPANAVDAVADFRTIITADRIVTLNSTQAVGTIDFDNPAGNYTISGSGGLTMDVSSGNASINVASGNHTIALPVTLNDGLTINVIPAAASLTLSGQITGGSQAISKIGQGTADVKNLRAAAVNVSEGKLRVISNGSSAGTSKVTSILVNTGNGAKLDLTNNDAVIEYSASSPRGTWTGSQYTGLQGLIASGNNNDTWTGPGIISSAAAATPGYTTLGIAEASEALGLSGSQTAVWSGQIVDSTSVLIGYTYAGDLNLDGAITGDDYFLIDSNFPAQGSPLITSAGAGSLLPVGVSAVPEPASIAAASLVGASLLARRRRR
jgi:hypothetical protein